MSGGQQQRVAIARAVISRPKILYADEPTGNVDDRIAARLMHLFDELNKLGTTVVIATHNESIVNEFGRPILRIDSGRLKIIPQEDSHIRKKEPKVNIRPNLFNQEETT
jgi:cell division transport system ATP-binding protein